MRNRKLHIFLWVIILLSLIPASILVVQRIQVEGRERRVTFIMDEQALSSQAEYYNMTSFELGERYRELGLNGIAIYEETISSLANKRDVFLQSDASLIARAIQEDRPLPDFPLNTLLMSESEAGTLSDFLAKYEPPSETLSLFNRDWFVYQNINVSQPAGPREKTLEQWSEAGWDIAYRPRNYPTLKNVGADYPAEANYIIYHGLQIAGHPNSLDDVQNVSQNYITGIIEGTPQAGLDKLSSKIPTARVLSFNQDYINQRLSPQDLVDKYLLAADERGVKILYLRPYIETQQGDLLENTEAFISLLRKSFEAEGFTVGPLGTLEFEYEPSALLRALSSVGALAALVLLALLYPGLWGGAVALFVFAVCFLMGGLDWDTLALAAALSFPVLGYGYFSNRLSSLGVATLITLVGVVLLAAIGSDRESMLAIRPFAGVALTLLAPPALFLFHFALKFRRPADYVTEFWQTPIQLGHIVIFLVGMAALALIVLRRGNFPIIGASEAELALRQQLSDLFVRPRFKELMGHPLGVLGLMNNDWPEWIRALFLTGGVIAQATVVNSFSHYHTPLLISLQRTLIALIIGLVVGLVLTPIIRLATRIVKNWLANAQKTKPTPV